MNVTSARTADGWRGIAGLRLERVWAHHGREYEAYVEGLFESQRDLLLSLGAPDETRVFDLRFVVVPAPDMPSAAVERPRAPTVWFNPAQAGQASTGSVASVVHAALIEVIVSEFARPATTRHGPAGPLQNLHEGPLRDWCALRCAREHLLPFSGLDRTVRPMDARIEVGCRAAVMYGVGPRA